MNWNNIRCGDTVKVKYGDIEISGEVSLVSGESIRIGTPGLYFTEKEVTLLEHTHNFRDGDVAIITTTHPGKDWVGIYDAESRQFTSGAGGVGHMIHSLGYSDGQVSSIKVVANINDDKG